MKYIRTKDGIYDKEKIINFAFATEYCSPNWDDDVERYLQAKIINQANTIEELCDEFVCLENKMTFHNLETITSSCNLKHLTIYGAIWTDKGLIYVAKMNDKGELELYYD